MKDIGFSISGEFKLFFFFFSISSSRVLKQSCLVLVVVLDKVPRMCCHGTQENMVCKPLNVRADPLPEDKRKISDLY